MKSQILNIFSGLTRMYLFLFLPLFIVLIKSPGFGILIFSQTLYTIFLVNLFFVVGKEIDFRFKIYYRVNSSMERFLYRFLMGLLTFFTLSIFLVALPDQVKLIIFGLFTIVSYGMSYKSSQFKLEEKLGSQFYEFKFLDSAEKTTLFGIVLTLIISFPDIPFFQNTEALKLYLDSSFKLNSFYWVFLEFVYSPFMFDVKSYNFSWFYHIYFVGNLIFLLTVYSLGRYIFSRRLSLLLVFSIVSSWAFSKFVVMDLMVGLSSTSSLILVWASLWVAQSSTYRSGLFYGLIAFWCSIFNAEVIFLYIIMLLIISFKVLKTKTNWYRSQWIKYNIMGILLMGLISFSLPNFTTSPWLDYFSLLLKNFEYVFSSKAFYKISLLLILYLFYTLLLKKRVPLVEQSERNRYLRLVFLFTIIILVFSILFRSSIFDHYSFIWLLALLSIIPLDWIFKELADVRSRLNFIYGLYFIACLMDSNLESRFRIFAKLFATDEIFKYIGY